MSTISCARLHVRFTNGGSGDRVPAELCLLELIHRPKATSGYYEEGPALVRRMVARLDHSRRHDGHVRHSDRYVST